MNHIQGCQKKPPSDSFKPDLFDRIARHACLESEGVDVLVIPTPTKTLELREPELIFIESTFIAIAILLMLAFLG